MKRTAAWLVFLGATALAQSPLTPAPRILQIFRETLRPGKEADYFRNEVDAVATLARLGFPRSFLGLSAATGVSDVWVLCGFDNYADVEQVVTEIAKNQALGEALGKITASKDGLLNEGRTIFAHHRDDISNGRGLSGARPRFFSITVVTVRAGHENEYAEIWRILRGGHQRAGLTDIHSIYEVSSGMADSTFLVLTPAGSLEEAGISRFTHGRRFEEALGPAAAAKLHELMSNAVLTSETNIFAIHPGISLPAKEWVDADPDFWKPPKQ